MQVFSPHATDFYKTGHRSQYVPGTEEVYSNFTSRSDKLANVLPDFDHKIVFAGLQIVILDFLINDWNETFFSQPLEKVIAKYKRRMDSSLGPDSVPVDGLEKLHKLGFLPVSIKALPEGSRVNLRVPPWTIRNTHGKDFMWVTNYLETALSAESWPIPTSATTAFEYRRLLDAYAKETGSDPAFVDWQGHDFSMRGMMGVVAATKSGIGHLLSFTGTDTISAIDAIEDFYCTEGNYPFIGGSVPATEHSVMCMGGQNDEIETFRRLIEDVYPAGIVSIVSDTWDFWQVITEYTVTLKDKIMTREGKVVFRPDSGDPVDIIVGDEEAPSGSPAHKGAIECLWDVFGGTITDKGYKLLDSHVGLIYGDSITLKRAQEILAGLKRKGFASGNVVFGIGSFTYQYVTRDSYGTAMKATWGVVNGEAREISKNPKTDNGIKKSAVGLLRVEKEGTDYVLYDRQTPEQEKQGALREVFRDGKLLIFQTFSEIKERLHNEAQNNYVIR
jgi:nicotinamide phosphoribosyltransferase